MVLFEKVLAVSHVAGRLPHEGRPGTGAVRGQGEKPAQSRRALFQPGGRGRSAHSRTWSSSSPTSISCPPKSESRYALLLEARLVKDIQPRFNIELKDNKSFPYLQISHARRAFSPRRQSSLRHRAAGVSELYGLRSPACCKSLRAAIQVLERLFQFRTCSLDIRGSSDDNT